MSVYDVYFRTKDGEQLIRKSESWNPDDAIHRLVGKQEIFPEAGDVVTRCVEVDRPKWILSSRGDQP
ncbi:MAG: hypothetical protein ACO1RT_10220 [Planctomycetaceae bacterium]